MIVNSFTVHHRRYHHVRRGRKVHKKGLSQPAGTGRVAGTHRGRAASICRNVDVLLSRGPGD